MFVVVVLVCAYLFCLIVPVFCFFVVVYCRRGRRGMFVRCVCILCFVTFALASGVCFCVFVMLACFCVFVFGLVRFSMPSFFVVCV